MRKAVRKGVNIDKLAHRLATTKQKGGTIKYKQGNPEDKVWINFQASKQQKREFAEVCKKHDINASAYLRRAIQLLIDKQGDVSNSVRELEKTDSETVISEKDTNVSLTGDITA